MRGIHIPKAKAPKAVKTSKLGVRPKALGAKTRIPAVGKPPSTASILGKYLR